MKPILENTEYEKQVRTAVEKYHAIVLLHVRRSFYEKSIKKGSSLTHTDLLNLCNTLFQNYSIGTNYKDRSKSILALIYGSSSKDSSSKAGKIYDIMLAKREYNTKNKKSELPKLDESAFRGVIQFLKNDAPGKSDYSLKLAISIFDIDVSIKSLFEASKNIESLKSELKSLREQAILVKDPGKLIGALRELEDSIIDVQEGNIETSGALESIKKDLKKSEHLSEKLKKNSKRNSLLSYTIAFILIIGSTGLFLINRPTQKVITMLDIELSNPIAASNQVFQEEFHLQGVLNETKSINNQLLSFKLSNYTANKSYFVDAVSLEITASPSRVPTIEYSGERQVDSLHFLLKKETTYYSVKIYSGDQIPPKMSSFFSVFVGGDLEMKNLEFTFQIIVEGHDSQGNSISISSPKDYSITFR